jgi:hypothetical protein
MTPALLDKMQSLLQTEFDVASQNLIVKNADGGYHLFGLFDVHENQDMIEVFRGNTKLQEFTQLQLALSWCIAEKYQQNLLSLEIVRLHKDLVRLRNTTHALDVMTDRITDRDRRSVTRVKTEDSRYRLASVQNQLTKCVSRAKYLQIRGFNDEIARTRRPAPNRSSRPGHRKPNR